MFQSRLRWVAAAALLLVGGLIAYRIVNRPGNGQAVTAPPVVRVVAPRLGDVVTTVALTGAISARNEMPIGPEGEGGRIAAVYVEIGDRVKRGQALARIDPTVAESQAAAAEAALQDARASSAAAQAEFARAERARDAFSIEELERRRTLSATAEAKVSLAEAQLRESRTRLARTLIVAPSAGIVLTRNAEVGQIAVPGSSVLFKLAQDGELEMRGLVAEQDMPRLKPGQRGRVYISGVATPYQGKVWQVGAIIDPQSRQGSARIALTAGDPNLRPGAFARAEVEVAATRGAIVPQTALLTDDAGSYVLVVGPDSKVERRAVSVAGAQSDGLLVSAGLQGNERVVATAGAFLRIGEAVSVAQDGEAINAGSGTRNSGGGAAVGNAAAP